MNWNAILIPLIPAVIALLGAITAHLRINKK